LYPIEVPLWSELRLTLQEGGNPVPLVVDLANKWTPEVLFALCRRTPQRTGRFSDIFIAFEKSVI